MEITTLPDAVSHHLWPNIRTMLEPADDSGEVFNLASDVLWLAIEDGIVWGAATTRLMTDGTAELRLVAGARFRDWIGPMDGLVEQWARDAGAHRLVTWGRKGWKRFANACGWGAPVWDTEQEKWRFEKPL